MRRTLALSTAVMLMVGGLAVFGFVSAKQAKREAKRARIAEEKANRAADESERSDYTAKVNLMAADAARDDFERVNRLLDETQGSKYRGFEWGYWKQEAQRATPTLQLDSYQSRASYSPDGRKILTTGSDGVTIWDARSRERVSLLKLRAARRIDWSIWSPRGDEILTLDDERTLRVWVVATSKTRLTIHGQQNPVILQNLMYSLDGRKIILAEYNGAIQILDAGTGQTVRRLDLATKTGEFWPAVCINPANSMLYAINSSGAVIRGDTKTGKLARQLKLGVEAVIDAVFSSDAITIYTNGRNDISAWDVGSGRRLYTLPASSQFDTICVSPDSTKLLASTGDRTNSTSQWDLKSRTLTETRKGTFLRENRPGCISPDSSTALLTVAETVKMWDLRPQKDPHRVYRLPGRGGGICSARFSSDGSKILLGTGNNMAVELLRPFSEPPHIYRGKDFNRRERRFRIMFATYIGKLDRPVFIGGNDLIRFDDPQTGKPLFETQNVNLGMLDNVYSESDVIMTVYTARGSDRSATLQLWKQGDKTVRKFSAATDAVALSPDAQLVAGAVGDNALRVWNGNTAQVVADLGHSTEVDGVTFAPSGRWLLTSTTDRMLHVWDLASRRIIHNFGPLPSGALCLKITPDGRRIVYGTITGDLILLDSETGAEMLRLSEHKDMVQNVAISSDGKEILATDIPEARLYTSDPSAGVGPK